ncbi:hypothetical protein ACFRCW_42465 [Streptomyces sp. NPDC056653]|uniref:hypothetical protein n=1 Tax=Streptomyces sp. NPDC056653 TaxID=3345894 RepID=UPI0036A852A2
MGPRRLRVPPPLRVPLMATGLADTTAIERHLYRALTGNRLSARTENVDNAVAALGKLERPWETGIMSRETWRRWNLPPGAKNAQRPSKRHAADLLAFLRRARMSKQREASLRQGNVTMTLWSRYDLETRIVGPQTLQWSGNDRIIDAYLQNGIGAAAQALLGCIGTDHFRTWIDPVNHESDQGYDMTGLDLMASPPRGARTRETRRRK